MKKTEFRDQQLLGLLKDKGRVSVAEACAALDISAATARRQFNRLVDSGQAVRDYGGIRLMHASDDYSFDRRFRLHDSEKRRIGMLAAQWVHNGDSIYLDSGTTLIHMAEALRRRMDLGEVGHLTIVTNSIVNLNALAGGEAHSRVLLLGGEYNVLRKDFAGAIAEKCLELFHFGKCFLGTEGLSARQGFTIDHLALSRLNSDVITRSSTCHVLMDHSKFGSEALIRFAPLEAADVIFTDTTPPVDFVEAFEGRGLKAVIAK